MTYKTRTIEQINNLKDQLDRLLPIGDKDEARLRKKLRLEFNYNSNHLEGNTLTYGQTQLLLIYDKSSGDVPVSDIEEMKAHDLALTEIEEMAKEKERPLTQQFIKELNKTILVKPFWKKAMSYDGQATRKEIKIGQYKTLPNSVRLKNGEIHEYASPEETPAKMNDLLSWYAENSDLMHPVQLAAEFHYRFVSIHPFDDGNGRVARLVMNYILLRYSYPPVIIKSVDKEAYLTALQKADTGNVLALIEYIEKEAIWSIELSIKAAKGEGLEEIGDIEKEIELLKREKLTKSKIFKTPKVSYDLFHHINNDIWNPLDKLLGKFDDFFAETKTVKYVDHEKVKKTRTIRSGLMTTARLLSDREVPVNNYEVLGYDLEEVNVKEFRWSKEMLSLKSASKKIDYEIECRLKLDESTYNLSIRELNTNTKDSLRNASTLFETKNEYKTLFMNDMIQDIIRMVSSHMIKVIKMDD